MAPKEPSNHETQKRARSKVILYLILVALFSSVFYYLIISSQSLVIFLAINIKEHSLSADSLRCIIPVMAHLLPHVSMSRKKSRQ